MEGLILAQLARRQTAKEVAKWARSTFAMETKFDGERVQIHRNKESLGEKIILDQKYERFRSERVWGYGCFVLRRLKKK